MTRAASAFAARFAARFVTLDEGASEESIEGWYPAQ
jgi:hypothetical protein